MKQLWSRIFGWFSGTAIALAPALALAEGAGGGLQGDCSDLLHVHHRGPDLWGP